jgi:multidrug efflux pump subunit AcrB
MAQAGGTTVSTLWEGDYGLPVVLKDERSEKADFDHLSAAYVQPTMSHGAIPLRQVAEVQPTWSEGKIVHRNGMRCITVTAELQRGVIAADVQPEIQAVMEHDVHIPQGVRTEIGGEVENDAESVPQLGAGIAIALVIIFFFILFNFRKYGITIVSMLAITLFLPGAMFGLWVTNSMMGITTIFGFITLMGMIMRNEILIFEHAESLRRQGWTARDAAYDAGRRRMVPIFLTTATTAVGVIPMIVSGSSMWKPVGITIFAGGIGALVLVVTLLPVIYWKIYEKKK